MAKKHLDMHDELHTLAATNVTLTKKDRDMLIAAANMLVDAAVTIALLETDSVHRGILKMDAAASDHQMLGYPKSE